MIKIHLNNEKAILDFHYDNLTRQVGREWTVIFRLKRLIKKHDAVPNLVSMYEFLLSKVEKDKLGFSILTAKPLELKSFLDDFETRFRGIIDNKINKELEHVFYYDEYDKWKAYELAKKINLNVCPYCNRMFTFLLGNDLVKGTRFEYDHFYAKSIYPYLRLSFFNLIPSCHVCNSNLKGKKEFKLECNIHPYVEGFSDNLVFSIKPKNVEFINGNHSAYRIKFKKGTSSSWDKTKVVSAFRNIATFRLSLLYNMHKDYVDEIIKKAIIYNPAYISGLYTQFQGKLFKDINEVQRFLLGNYTEERDYDKRVLSKLTTDISKELGII